MLGNKCPQCYHLEPGDACFFFTLHASFKFPLDFYPLTMDLTFFLFSCVYNSILEMKEKEEEGRTRGRERRGKRRRREWEVSRAGTAMILQHLLFPQETSSIQILPVCTHSQLLYEGIPSYKTYCVFDFVNVCPCQLVHMSAGAQGSQKRASESSFSVM